MRLSLLFFGLSSVFMIASSLPLGSIGLEKRQAGGIGQGVGNSASGAGQGAGNAVGQVAGAAKGATDAIGKAADAAKGAANDLGQTASKLTSR
ncbi:hypothetical protein G6F46_007485 [Rhizopus delemar]|uniref:Uncharacterized protein n=3 Tax=Rhizopus TaxID=4842 RepID=I1CC61_RHIO9|nr:hypothetical protein RO3G_10752 [Rhizopus delemar RA 99-880]KAG1455103.1 hypothetical protein G6F55_007263 [Rhizopus delemar]KAG1537983.1 hypothetical protein G6F51_010042 [Rhizopus arrhizus]KAG1496020.1 hypothetical protein G6F54_006768 [Rhizopus delemar]KAG1506365.1 hypothetical protein G6F53_009743 [Rhizopus delemar]|eukprot:EIE86041.1 hypothetical protein RO3G_10752 [Rhizopus delemar RA 99-880]